MSMDSQRLSDEATPVVLSFCQAYVWIKGKKMRIINWGLNYLFAHLTHLQNLHHLGSSAIHFHLAPDNLWWCLVVFQLVPLFSSVHFISWIPNSCSMQTTDNWIGQVWGLLSQVLKVVSNQTSQHCVRVYSKLCFIWRKKYLKNLMAFFLAECELRYLDFEGKCLSRFWKELVWYTSTFSYDVLTSGTVTEAENFLFHFSITIS